MRSIVDIVHLRGMQLDHLIPQQNIKAAFLGVNARDERLDWTSIKVLSTGWPNLIVVDVRCHDTADREMDMAVLEDHITK